MSQDIRCDLLLKGEQGGQARISPDIQKCLTKHHNMLIYCTREMIPIHKLTKGGSRGSSFYIQVVVRVGLSCYGYCRNGAVLYKHPARQDQTALFHLHRVDTRRRHHAVLPIQQHRRGREPCEHARHRRIRSNAVPHPAHDVESESAVDLGISGQNLVSWSRDLLGNVHRDADDRDA